MDLSIGYSCGSFDPVVAVSNSLNDIGAGADNMMNAMTAAASGAIAALPALILQRANPGLYDLFQNALLKAETSMELATKSCESMEAEIAQGRNPYADLITVSKGNDWKRQMGIGGNDAVTAKASVETSNGGNGVPWISGTAGGAGQAPLELTGDVVEAGYLINLNQSPDNPAQAPVIANSRLQALWPEVDDARAWVVSVVGDQIVTTCDACDKQSVPGVGLLPTKHRESVQLTERLEQLMSGAEPMTLDNLNTVSAPGIAVTRQLLESIQELPPSEQGLMARRLVAEIATARTVEKALMARRLLLTGRQVPEVYATNVAREHIDSTLVELDQEIDNLLFETRVRREIVSDTALVLLQRAEARKRSSLSQPTVPVVDPKPLRGGRVEQ